MKADCVVVSKRGYIVLPLHLRKEMNLKIGTKILVKKEEKQIILQPISSFTERLSGLTEGSFGKDAAQVRRYIDREREDR